MSFVLLFGLLQVLQFPDTTLQQLSLSRKILLKLSALHRTVGRLLDLERSGQVPTSELFGVRRSWHRVEQCGPETAQFRLKNCKDPEVKRQRFCVVCGFGLCFKVKFSKGQISDFDIKKQACKSYCLNLGCTLTTHFPGNVINLN